MKTKIACSECGVPMSIRESAATHHSGLCIICTSRLKVSAKKTSGIRSAIGSASLQKAAQRVA